MSKIEIDLTGVPAGAARAVSQTLRQTCGIYLDPASTGVTGNEKVAFAKVNAALEMFEDATRDEIKTAPPAKAS